MPMIMWVDNCFPEDFAVFLDISDIRDFFDFLGKFWSLYSGFCFQISLQAL